jgi:phosphoglycolate phosphatase
VILVSLKLSPIDGLNKQRSVPIITCRAAKLSISERQFPVNGMSWCSQRGLGANGQIPLRPIPTLLLNHSRQKEDEMAIQAVIFDLDGTLLDTLADLAAAVNRVLTRQGFPRHDVDAYRWFIGHGSAVLMKRALPPTERSPERIQACLQELLDDYGRNWHHLTRPYDGIVDLLQTLAERHIPMAVVTNKPHRFATLMIAHYFNSSIFGHISGQRDGIPKKPDPSLALATAHEMGVVPGNCLFLGDSAVDIETARRAGMLAVGAAWGFRPVSELRDAGATHVIEQPIDLLSLIGAP